MKEIKNKTKMRKNIIKLLELALNELKKTRAESIEMGPFQIMWVGELPVDDNGEKFKLPLCFQFWFEPLLTAEFLAEEFKVTERTITNWRQKGMPKVQLKLKDSKTIYFYPLYSCKMWARYHTLGNLSNVLEGII